MVNTRPDIAFVISKLTQYILEPTKYYKRVIKHLLKYLRSIKDIYIRYSPESPKLIGYSNVDYVSDKSNRKLMIGNVFILTGGTIS